MIILGKLKIKRIDFKNKNSSIGHLNDYVLRCTWKSWQILRVVSLIMHPIKTRYSKEFVIFWCHLLMRETHFSPNISTCQSQQNIIR